MALRPAVPPPVPRAERTFSTVPPSSCQEQPAFLQNRVCWGSSPPQGGVWWRRCGCQDPCEVRWRLGGHIVSAGSPEASGGPGRPGGPEVRSLLPTSRGRSRETPSGSLTPPRLSVWVGGLQGRRPPVNHLPVPCLRTRVFLCVASTLPCFDGWNVATAALFPWQPLLFLQPFISYLLFVVAAADDHDKNAEMRIDAASANVS